MAVRERPSFLDLKAEGQHQLAIAIVELLFLQSNGSDWRSMPKLTNLILRFVLVCFVSPVKGIFLRLHGLCRTKNLPKLFSFSVNPFVPRCEPVPVSELHQSVPR